MKTFEESDAGEDRDRLTLSYLNARDGCYEDLIPKMEFVAEIGGLVLGPLELKNASVRFKANTTQIVLTLLGIVIVGSIYVVA